MGTLTPFQASHIPSNACYLPNLWCLDKTVHGCPWRGSSVTHRPVWRRNGRVRHQAINADGLKFSHKKDLGEIPTGSPQQRAPNTLSLVYTCTDQTPIGLIHTHEISGPSRPTLQWPCCMGPTWPLHSGYCLRFGLLWAISVG